MLKLITSQMSMGKISTEVSNEDWITFLCLISSPRNRKLTSPTMLPPEVEAIQPRRLNLASHCEDWIVLLQGFEALPQFKSKVKLRLTILKILENLFDPDLVVGDFLQAIVQFHLRRIYETQWVELHDALLVSNHSAGTSGMIRRIQTK